MASSTITAPIIRPVRIEASSSESFTMRGDLAVAIYKRNTHYGILLIESYTDTAMEIGSQLGYITVTKSNSSKNFTISNALSYGMMFFIIGA